MTPAQWLEAQSCDGTEVIARVSEADGIIRLRTRGGARRRMDPESAGPECIRAMIEVIPDGHGSTMKTTYNDPCPVCDNFAYTRPCPDHPDLGSEGINFRAPGTQVHTREMGSSELDIFC